MNRKKSLQERIRGWFPQEPKLGLTTKHTAPLTKTNPNPLTKEYIKQIKKPIMQSICLINFGVFLCLLILYTYALDDSYFYLNAVQNTALLVAVFGVCSFLIILGILGLKTYKDTVSFKGRLKFLEITPNVVGCALMSIGIYVVSFYISRPLPNSVPDFYSWHPYVTLGFDLFSAGAATLMAAAVLYSYLIPRQIATRLREISTSSGSRLQG